MAIKIFNLLILLILINHNTYGRIVGENRDPQEINFQFHPSARQIAMEREENSVHQQLVDENKMQQVLVRNRHQENALNQLADIQQRVSALENNPGFRFDIPPPAYEAVKKISVVWNLFTYFMCCFRRR
jgi:hypothetical protein